MTSEEYQRITVENTWLYDTQPGSTITVHLYLSKNAGKSRKLMACVYDGNLDIEHLVLKKFSKKYGIDNFRAEMREQNPENDGY